MKKILAVVLSLIFTLMLITSVFAYDVEREYTCYNAFSDTMEIDSPLNSQVISDIQTKEYFKHSVGNPDFRAYTLLNDCQKKVYDAIKNAPIGTMSITTSFSVGELSLDDFTKSFLTEIMHAVCYDLPEIFYHSGYSANYSYTSSGYVTKVVYNVSMYSNVSYSASTVASCYNQMMSKIDGISLDTSNRYNFVKSLHDYLCNNIIYPDLNSSLYISDCHDSYGALVKGYAVCQGYAESFKLICNLYNIPCVYISGTANGGGHGWNAVQMDDGKWYFIDATWDDQETYLFYDFFLCGLNSTPTHFSGGAFSSSHVPDSDLFLPNLNYGSEFYSQTNHNTRFAATYNASPDYSGKYLYLSVFDAGKSNVYYNGIYVPVNSFSNNESFSVPSGVNSSEEEWTMILLGDLNSDDACDAMDYSASINLWKSSDDVINTTQERCCDVNLDGVIDVLDLAIIARASTGANTDIVLE